MRKSSGLFLLFFLLCLSVNASAFKIEEVENLTPNGSMNISSIDVHNDIPHITYINGIGDLIYASWNPTSENWTKITIKRYTNESNDVYRYTSIKIDTQGNAHISYQTEKREVVYAKVNATTGSVTTESIFYDRSSILIRPKIFLTDNDEVYIAFYVPISGKGWKIAKQINNSSWSFSNYYYTPHYSTMHFDFFVEYNGMVHITTMLSHSDSRYGTTLGLNYITWDGSTWSHENITSGNTYIGHWNSLVVDSLGNPHVSYCDTYTDHSLMYAHHNGTHWSYETVESYSNLECSSTSIMLDSSNSPHIIFEDNNNQEIKHYDQLGQANWRGQVAHDNFETYHLEAAIDFKDHIHVTYGDLDGGGQFYGNSFDPTILSNYSINSIIVNGYTTHLLNGTSTTFVNKGDVFQFVGTGAPNSSFNVVLEDPKTMQSIYFTAHTDNGGTFYYPQTYIEAASTHKLSLTEEQTFVYRFSNGQSSGISSMQLSFDPLLIEFAVQSISELGPLINQENNTINPDVINAVRFRQIVNNGETIPVYTGQEVQSILRGEELIAQWAQEDFEEMLKQHEFISNNWSFFVYGTQAFVCTTAIMTAPAHAGAGAVIACTPLILHIAKDTQTAAINALAEKDVLTDKQAAYLKAGTTVQYMIAGFAVGDVAGGGSATFEAIEFIDAVADGTDVVAELASVSEVQVGGSNLRYLKTTWNYTPSSGPSGQVTMLVYAGSDSSIFKYMPAILD